MTQAAPYPAAPDTAVAEEGAGRTIQVLPPEEARRIAAGEVIDRPAALVREFMDNAIDAGAAAIDLVIEAGGVRRLEVIDDGGGMTRENLAVCWEAHATSKIRSLDDLSRSRTLGFRGEALSAAMSAAKLEILSSVDGREAWLLEIGPGKGNGPRLSQTRRVRGTSVRAIGLFDSIPARKRFLKRDAGEAALCRQIFTEKALAFPERNFRFTQDGRQKLFFPAVSSYMERFAEMLDSGVAGHSGGYGGAGNFSRKFLHEIGAAGQGFSAAIISGGPELYRADRRQQYLFANGRRIQDYALLQAFEYGLQHWFPNGVHPVGAIYLDIDPALADFNIHPAKREARFRDAGAIHRAISAALISYTRAAFGRGEAGGVPPRGRITDAASPPSGGSAPRSAPPFSGPLFGEGPAGPLAMEALLDARPGFAPLPRPETDGGLFLAEQSAPYDAENARAGGTRYVGRAFELFILVERDGRLYLIDQHAAHERLLYNRFLAGTVPRQDLLVPIPFVTESADDDRFLREQREDLARLGIVLEHEDGAWRVTALPAGWQRGDAETVEAILSLKTAGANMAERWAASLSCRQAVKDGDYLDSAASLALAEAALALPVSRCPHGRPVWKELTREELFRAVRRIE
ncbi:MAG: DNA mismatch repair endonuclease MutL [Spirochaetaceae bacterium]|nr:DNA mismatch repair endonuclease MutL [Spirochaetaceae bacterium]